MTRLCFDYDSIKYAIGFACEERHIVCTHKNNGGQLRFANRTEFYGGNKKGGWLAEFNAERDSPHAVDEYDIQDIQTLKQDTSVKNMLDTKIKGVVKHLQARDYYGYIGRGKVFRHEIATIMQYKGNRNNLKPLAINTIEELLFEHHNAKLATDNLESDDWLSIDSFTAFKEWNKTKSLKDRLICVTPDKDHLQVEGHLFNADKMVLPMTIKGFGNLEWKEDMSKVLAGCMNDKEALQAIVDTYKSWYPKHVEYISWDGKPMVKNWLEIADENWQMGYMKRWVGDDTMFSKVIDKLGVQYD